MDGFDPQQALQSLTGAAPEELDAHRSLLSEIFQTLEGQGVSTANIAAQAGSSTADPCAMSHDDLLCTTLALARQHPEIVQTVAQRFPEAQGLLNTVLGGGGAAPGGGGFLGGLLGRL